jgi:hypothetical protein
MSWKTGNFEIMAAEPDRPRTIEKTHHNLLLETVQAIDEAEPAPDGSSQPRNSENSKFMNLAHREGVEFMLSLPHDPNASFEVYALQDAAPKAVWFQSAMETFSNIGKMLHIGSPTDLLLEDEQIYIALVRCNTADLCIGFSKAMSVVQIHEIKTQIVTEWDA